MLIYHLLEVVKELGLTLLYYYYLPFLSSESLTRLSVNSASQLLCLFIKVPEAATGVIGVGLIGISVISSKKAAKEPLEELTV